MTLSSLAWRDQTSELNVDNWNDNCEAKSEAKSPRPLPQNRKGTEGQLGSEPLMFLSSRMSPRASELYIYIYGTLTPSHKSGKK